MRWLLRRLVRPLLWHWYAGRVLPILLANPDCWRSYARYKGVDLLEQDETYGSIGWACRWCAIVVDRMLDGPEERPLLSRIEAQTLREQGCYVNPEDVEHG